MRKWMSGALVLLALAAAGCEDQYYSYDASGNSAVRGEGDWDLSPDSIRRSPYSPILGYTTGDGLPVNMNTGGGITAGSVTPLQQLDAGRSAPTANPPAPTRVVPPIGFPTTSPALPTRPTPP